MNSGSRKQSDMDEVEELLRAAQDDMLLKLSVDSSIVRSSNGLSSDDSIDPDLDRRFQALRSRPKPKSNPNPKPTSSSSSSSQLPNPPPSTDGFEKFADSEDDLFARFAALKGSIPSLSSTSAVSASNDWKREDKDNDDEDEVNKVIRWAIDAARLDPSPCSDEDDSENDEFTDDDDDDGRIIAGERKS